MIYQPQHRFDLLKQSSQVSKQRQDSKHEDPLDQSDIKRHRRIGEVDLFEVGVVFRVKDHECPDCINKTGCELKKDDKEVKRTLKYHSTR